MRVCIVIPAYEPGEELIAYVKELCATELGPIVAVDDGSGARYAHIFDALRGLGCTVLTHAENRGKGAAIKTALKWYGLHGGDTAGANSAGIAITGNDGIAGADGGGRYTGGCAGIVTVDCDGQHTVRDVRRVCEAMASHPHALVLGCRDFGGDTPQRSAAGNRAASAAMRALYDIDLKDTQTGLRGIPNAMHPELLELRGERYEYELNMLIRAKQQGYAFAVVPIETVYFNNNAGSHYRTVADSARILLQLCSGVVQYALSAGLSAAVDVLLYGVLVKWVLRALPTAPRLLWAAVIARVFSSIVNYACNRCLPYVQEKRIGVTMAKYYCLWLVQLTASIAGTGLLCTGLHMDDMLAKLLIDALLAIASYQVQLRWVFRKKETPDDAASGVLGGEVTAGAAPGVSDGGMPACAAPGVLGGRMPAGTAPGVSDGGVPNAAMPEGAAPEPMEAATGASLPEPAQEAAP